MLKMAPIPLFAFFLLLTHLVLPSSAQEYRNHSGCQQFSCGKLGPISFPFNNMTNPECGVVTVDCSEDISKIQFKDGGHWFGIDSINQADYIFVKETVPLPYLNSPDYCKLINDFSFPSSTNSSIFLLANEKSLKLYNCSHSLHTPSPLRDLNQTTCGDYDFYCNPPNMSFPFEQQCQNIMLPFSLPLPPLYSIPPPPSINITFQVQTNPVCLGCISRGGKCDNINVNQVQCIVPQKGLSKKQKLGLGLAVAFGGIGTLVVMLIYCFRKKYNHAHQSIEAFLKNCGPLQIRRYRYSNIKKMTNSFKEKLGQGGFGSVYKGKLHDGHLVAVKMLNELKANDGEDFINEVAAISRTSHVNVVRLLGFCFEGAKKALIYEFMPNGSLEKIVYDEDESEESYQLDWETYYQISIGTARGLEYLHRGCNRRILHFDIKPHNILLDADFVPKISDFGLAKICTRKDSLVSMLGPRGTIGYIAPEVFSRNFGGVSHKSDVYSYGMMVLEIVGGRKNVNIRVDNNSELYFPQWIYERLELKELGLKRIISEEDNVKSRKMIMTSLWCIQTDPSSRPTMSRVIEMLEGSLDSLKVPPKPFLSSPPRSSPSDSSNILIYLYEYSISNKFGLYTKTV
ncbi:LEAF RUST 10 DISEASE-RESISTANCE LOCUS RECEPTOR-LIKE PROTEIN KINASE-like 2.4 isoform X1 [Humulus lupulus]|uniref:LEAF RUST 10 DISEASE-RESISTANCE LOCUS RECEPTOR-LIKE PROTEIN KINASE-like 2.4 isoform X1 n=1 Tax=Humulus lupulus TaxID=3486 RepID=UPI002B4096AD|nr:LEAF RUST 10 DISEASE-RESISTANCE LOCUS RECEPTOR-LIKE PROTEIN KINASE-like 2.4 isoform X1 [Humulus lupulus]